MRPLEQGIIAMVCIAVFAYGFHLTDILADNIERLAHTDQTIPGWNAIVLLRFYSILAAIGAGMLLAALMKTGRAKR